MSSSYFEKHHGRKTHPHTNSYIRRKLLNNSSTDSVEQFKYFEKNFTNKNYIQEEIKSRFKSGNICYYSVHNLMSSSF
jgi:hypothetical protein